MNAQNGYKKYPSFSNWCAPGKDKIVALGDSIVASDPSVAADFCTWLRFKTGINVVNKGVSGDAAQDVIDRLTADCINLVPGAAIILIGTNDVDADSPLATIAGKLVTITTTLVTAGITPIWCTLLPRSDDPLLNPPIRKLNYWIKAHCQERGLPLIDLYTLFANPNGTPKTGYLTDGLHPTVLGQKAIANHIASYLPRANRTIPWRLAGDAENLMPNGDFTSDPLSHGWGDEWTPIGDAGDGKWTTALEANPNGGNWQVGRKLATTGDTYFGFQCALTLTAEKSYRVEFDVQQSANCSTIMSVLFTGGTPDSAVLFNHVYSFGERLWVDFTVPASTTAVAFRIYSSSASAFELKMGRGMCFELPAV